MKFHAYFLFLLVRPISQVIFWALAAQFATGITDPSFQLIGNSVFVCTFSSLFTTADILVEERRGGTLPLLVVAAKNKFLVFSGRALVVGMHGIFTSIVTFLVGSAIFRLNLSQVAWGQLGLTLGITVFSVSCLGVCLGTVGVVLTDLNLIGNVVYLILIVICGVQFPTAMLPEWLQILAYVVPITRGAEAARLIVAGGGPKVWPLLGGELLVGIAWLIIGYSLYRYLEYKARVYGTLDLY